MSQIELNLSQFFARNPHIESCIHDDLINRRALARYLIKEGIVKKDDFEALIACLRRYGYKQYSKEDLISFNKIKINIKENILILDFEKDKRLLQELKKLIESTSYDKGDTLKIVMGSTSIKLFIDLDKERSIDELVKKFKVQNRYAKISELSLLFPKEAIETKGILSYITKEFYINGILISEILTSSPELLIYVKDEYVLKAYEVVKRCQSQNLPSSKRKVN